jgi:NTE family protein
MSVLGIALGSGGARGLAHIGVLRELVEMGMSPQVVAGTSIGSLVGAAYCAGKLEEVATFAEELDVKGFLMRFMEISFPRSGLLEGRKINEFLDEIFPGLRFEDLDLPFRCVATDLADGGEVVFSSGPLQCALRASIAVPGIFTPLLVDGRVLVDGGLVNPIPVDHVLAMGADHVIAVDINDDRMRRSGVACKKPEAPEAPAVKNKDRNLPSWLSRFQGKLEELDGERQRIWNRWTEPAPIPGLIDVIGNTIHIVENQIGVFRLKLDPPAILLRPKVGNIRLLDFHMAEQAIEAGRQAVREQADQIRALV